MLLLATDLDGTFLGGKSVHKQQLYRMIRSRQDIRLVFVTGRGLETVIPLLNDPVIPHPDYIICDVGATLVNGRSLDPIQPIQSAIEAKWPGRLATKNKLKKVNGLRWQEVPQTRRSSYFYDEQTDMEHLREVVEGLNCDLLISAGKFLDVLPRGVNKGSTLKQLIKLLQFPEENILVAGDTMNDLSLYKTGYKGVVVGRAEPKLLEAVKGMDAIYCAEDAGAGGILEAINHFPGFQAFTSKPETQKPTTSTGANQLLMVYHRLPFEVQEVNGERINVPHKSPNGIIPSLTGFFRSGRSGVWIAWEQIEKKTQTLRNIYVDEENFPNLLASRIGLTKKDVDIFYKIFSKEAFWPTIFSFIDKVEFNHLHWEHFVKINKLFAEKTAAEADQGALVWLHDYNLWMVPGFLRQLRPDLKIGFFHHTSFPPADIFNIIPWRGEIIGSLLQCDYIGFHIPRYVENFMDVVRSQLPVKVLKRENMTERFLSYSCPMGVETMTSEIIAGDRKIRMGAHPVGVNVKYIQEVMNRPETTTSIDAIRKEMGSKKVILSVERLDYVKGPLEKIYAFQEFLEEYPEFHEKIVLINICTPPAQGMKIYEKVQQELEQAIGKINGRYSTVTWTPIRFFFRSFKFEDILQHYAVADIAWITPLRDGLNLVAKEYVAVQGMNSASSGVLVLSEFAGASVELGYAVRTNPYDRKSLKESLLQALVMEQPEKEMRMRRLYDSVVHYDIEHWGEGFLKALEGINSERDWEDNQYAAPAKTEVLLTDEINN